MLIRTTVDVCVNADPVKSPDGCEKEVHLQYDARATGRPGEDDDYDT